MARYEVGDRVMYRDTIEEVVALAEPDAVGDIITVDDGGEYVMRCESQLAPGTPPDPRDAVVEAAVAWVDSWCAGTPPSTLGGALYDAVQAWKAAQ